MLTIIYRKALWMKQRVTRRLERPLRRITKQSPILMKTRDELLRRYYDVLRTGAGLKNRPLGRKPVAQITSVNPENMIWIFCTSRSGSTWLRSMMAEFEEHKVWEEPSVGRLFGDFYHRASKGQLASTNFIMGNAMRKEWIRLIRNFILDAAHYTHPLLKTGHYLVIKEPNGSTGAPLIMEAFPESRMIFLIRDPRDVAASLLDATRKGGWVYEGMNKAVLKEKTMADKKPDNFVRARANSYLSQVESIKEAYNAHKGRKVMIRYEDLRADTLGTMKRICSGLELPVKEETLIWAAAKHSWERVPRTEKGEGKFYRKATPGGWREDLTSNQAQIVESITAPLLKEFYP